MVMEQFGEAPPRKSGFGINAAATTNLSAVVSFAIVVSCLLGRH
jgi:hypothetical protein